MVWNITDSSVDNFYVKQSYFLSFDIMKGKNLSFEDLTCSAFASNARAGANWVQNVDGFCAASPFKTSISHELTSK